MRQIKFAWTLAFVSPIKQKFSVGRELCDAIVAVTVRDVDAAVRRKGDVGGKVEMGSVDAGDLFSADGQEKFAVVRELKNLLKSAVGDPDVVAGVDAQAVRLDETIFAPR